MAGRIALLRSETPPEDVDLKFPHEIRNYSRTIPREAAALIAQLLGRIYEKPVWMEAQVMKTFCEDVRVKKVWTVWTDNQIIGVAAVQVREENGHDGVNVHWISVAPEQQGTGIGRKLMHEVWKWARENQKKVVWAYSETFSAKVERFYKKLNFVELPLPNK